jgi:hypothetical protein
VARSDCGARAVRNGRVGKRWATTEEQFARTRFALSQAGLLVGRAVPKQLSRVRFGDLGFREADFHRPNAETGGVTVPLAVRYSESSREARSHGIEITIDRRPAGLSRGLHGVSARRNLLRSSISEYTATAERIVSHLHRSWCDGLSTTARLSRLSPDGPVIVPSECDESARQSKVLTT